MKNLFLVVGCLALMWGCAPRAPFSVDFPLDGGDVDSDADGDADAGEDSGDDAGGDGGEDTDTDTGPEFPATCAEYLLANPSAVDGEYTIYVGNDGAKPWSVYCHDMAGTPTEYLTLINTGGDYNYSQLMATGPTMCSDPGDSNVVTHYNRLRINPTTFSVTIGDQAFSSSTGVCHWNAETVTSMPYAAALTCDHPSVIDANIDLTGTDFKVADTFCWDGLSPLGDAIFSSNDQVVALTGGGSCGWVTPCPGIDTPINGMGGDILDLEYIN